jgi:hypothetical protein
MSDELELEEEEYTSQLTGAVFRRILGLIRPHWKWALGFVITIALTSATDAYFTYLNKQFVDQGINMRDTAALVRLATIYGSIILFQAVTVFLFVYLAGVLGERIQYDLRKMMFNHLQELSLSYYAQNAVGRLIARVTSDTGRALSYTGRGGQHLGGHEHRHVPGVHGRHQLAPGFDCGGRPTDHGRHWHPAAPQDPGRIPGEPARKLEDYGRLQREHSGRPGCESAGP